MEGVGAPALSHLGQALQDPRGPARGIDFPGGNDDNKGAGDHSLLEIRHHHAPVAGKQDVDRADCAEQHHADPLRVSWKQEMEHLAHGDPDPAEDKHVHENLPAGEPAAQQLGAQAGEPQVLPLGLGVGQGTPEYSRADKSADRAPGAEKGVPESGQAVLIDHPADPDRGVGGGVGGIDAGGGEPPGQAAAGQEKVALAAARQTVEQDPAGHHEQDISDNPEPVEHGECDHLFELSF